VSAVVAWPSRYMTRSNWLAHALASGRKKREWCKALVVSFLAEGDVVQ
jgi:hypothetical protein